MRTVLMIHGRDSYDIFAINIVSVMLGYLYGSGDIPASSQLTHPMNHTSCRRQWVFEFHNGRSSWTFFEHWRRNWHQNRDTRRRSVGTAPLRMAWRHSGSQAYLYVVTYSVRTHEHHLIVRSRWYGARSHHGGHLRAGVVRTCYGHQRHRNPHLLAIRGMFLYRQLRSCTLIFFVYCRWASGLGVTILSALSSLPSSPLCI